jgi:flagellar basal-body rod modification protein FlgD
MMEAQNIGNLITTGLPGSDTAVGGVMGKEQFLELLIAQLKHQNPLQPLQDQEFIAQMTQFSSLEQLQNMNTTLSQNAEWDMLMAQTINNTMAASLIGREVDAGTALAAVSDGEASPITFETSKYAANGTITIYNEAGETVRVIPVADLQAGEHSINWDGKDSGGGELPPGSYSFAVDLYGTDGQSLEVDAYLRGTVTGVKYVQGQAFFEVNGALVPLRDVRGISMGESG